MNWVDTFFFCSVYMYLYRRKVLVREQLYTQAVIKRHRSVWHFPVSKQRVNFTRGSGMLVNHKRQRKKLADNQEVEIPPYNKGRSLWKSKFWTIKCHFTCSNTVMSDNCCPIPWKLWFSRFVEVLLRFFLAIFMNYFYTFVLLVR